MFFFEGYTVRSAFMWIGLIFILIILNELFRRSKRLTLLGFLITPVVIFGLIWSGKIGSVSSNGWFGQIKAISAIAGILGFWLIRYTKLGDTRFLGWFPLFILTVNIIEAIAAELQVYLQYNGSMYYDSATDLIYYGGIWNILNIIAGILLLFSISGWRGIRVANTKSKDMIWPDQIPIWILAYTAWNMSYCYNCISNRSMYAGLAILIAALIAELFIKRGAWLQHRAYTLAMFAMFSLTVDYFKLPDGIFSIVSTQKPEAMLTLSMISIILCALIFIYKNYMAIKNKRSMTRDDIYFDTKCYKKNLSKNNLK